MSEPVLATLRASPPRRFVGVAMLVVLSGLLIYLGLALVLGLAQIGLLLGGGIALALAVKMHRVTEQELELTREVLRIKGGEVLAEVENIAKVERGAFAFKPSNGFLIRLKKPVQRRWAPGLFWSYARKLGVGGVTGAPQSKAMVETLALLISES